MTKYPSLKAGYQTIHGRQRNKVVMIQKKLYLFVGLVSVQLLAFGQHFHYLDSVSTGDDQTHMFLSVEIPTGEFALSSSTQCGLALTRMAAADSAYLPSLQTGHDREGNHRRHLSIKPTGIVSQGNMSAASMRLSDHMTSLNAYTGENTIRTEYYHDPSMATDVSLDLGMGTSMLNLSDMMIKNLVIHSAFSDVNLQYDQPNKMQMDKMDIHVVRADIFIQNLEQAKVKLVTIQNDMGDTKVELGSNSPRYSTVYIQAGVGNCTLAIEDDHPVKIIVKRGMFSSLNFDEANFRKLDKNVLVNKAYRPDHPEEATKIICNVDLGDVNLVKN
ncbi:MAG: hypothetical protein AAFY70_10415 [Bacteroidota bacterium]